MYAIRSYYGGSAIANYPDWVLWLNRTSLVGIPLPRITSYNVCYTKLLRQGAHIGIAAAGHIDDGTGQDRQVGLLLPIAVEDPLFPQAEKQAAYPGPVEPVGHRRAICRA